MENQQPKPVRIQRSRKTKQISPNGLLIKYVGRPTKWGNPIKLIGDSIYIDAGYRRKILSKWVWLMHGNIKDVISIYKTLFSNKKLNNIDLKYWQAQFKKLDLSDIKDKNLSCWCRVGAFCHANYLLEIANK